MSILGILLGYLRSSVPRVTGAVIHPFHGANARARRQTGCGGERSEPCESVTSASQHVKAMTCGEAVVKLLSAYGVNTVFGMAGTITSTRACSLRPRSSCRHRPSPGHALSASNSAIDSRSEFAPPATRQSGTAHAHWREEARSSLIFFSISGRLTSPW
jgi:hypothetical protein